MNSVVALAVGLCGAAACVAADQGVQITDAPSQGKLQVTVNGKLFTEYHYKGYSRPFLYPIIGPGGAHMTRNWPMKNVPGEEQDHPHHKSLWWAHGDINGVDFWSESSRAGKTVHERFLEVSSGKDFGVIQTRNRLIDRQGKEIAVVDFAIRIYNRPKTPTLDFEATVHAADGDLVFGDTKEGTMAIRLAESMRLKPNRYNQGKPTGHIVTSAGARDNAAWGSRAAWVDYYGPVEGKIVGVAIFDHPANPRHPTWWHVRNYGLFAANPFGLHYFERKPPHTGDFRVRAGQRVTFRYRFYFHEGDEKQGKVAEEYAAYVRRSIRK